MISHLTARVKSVCCEKYSTIIGRDFLLKVKYVQRCVLISRVIVVDACGEGG